MQMIMHAAIFHDLSNDIAGIFRAGAELAVWT